MEAKIILVLMVKNESAILQRCLAAAAPFCDAIVVADTGSTDATLKIAMEFNSSDKPVHIVTDEWKNFGWNRSLSLKAARAWAEEVKWNLSEAYALVLDADMCILGSPEALRKFLTEAKPSGAHLLQIHGDMEYGNVRLMRLSDGWFCEGVTHEYWTGGGDTPFIAEARIHDIGDGGAKADKFERDERLLLAGLQEKPTCERYMFYLAQTYHCTNRHAEAIRWYEKRIQAGGWVEEVWYSHYMITCNYLRLGRPYEAELWAQLGLDLQPDRPEAIMQLVAHFREVSEHYKAWHYLLKAEAMKKPVDARLFLEAACYDSRPHFERSILQYYVKTDQAEAAMCCLSYRGDNEDVVLRNLSFFVDRFQAKVAKRIDFPTPEGFVSSSVAVSGSRDWTLCVRAVSYKIEANGAYTLRNGVVETRNFESSWCPWRKQWFGWKELHLDERCAARWRRDDYILGLEDVRLCGNTFTATTRQFSYCARNRIVHGSFSDMKFAPVRPPAETVCEKNWLPLGDTRVIYGWHPLTIGAIKHTNEVADLIVEKTIDTPAWFRHLRGSTPPFKVGEELWVLTHIVSPHAPRNYLHLWVALDAETLEPLAHTPPFYLHHLGIEYCLGAQPWPPVEPSTIHLFLSVWDRESWFMELSIEAIRARLRRLK